MTSSRYVPWMPIASGGMAEIWLGVLRGAEDYKRIVVMKRAAGETDAARDLARRALINEASLLARLSHPNIVQSHSLEELHAELYLVMEYLPGLSGRGLLRMAEGQRIIIPPQVSYRILADVALGLEHAHHATEPFGDPAGIVHGDVSPENFVVTESGITKIVDFGVAGSSCGGEPTVQGTKPSYTAPERYQDGPMTPAMDVFSLGMVARELLGGLRREDAAPPSTVAPAVRDAVERMVVRSAQQRTITMGEAAAVFATCAQDLGAGHADVAIFLRAEFAATLQARRLRLRLLLEKPEAVQPQRSRASTSSTTMALENVLDELPVADEGPKHAPLGIDDNDGT